MTQAVASSPLPTTPFRVALIGAGKVGTAVATLLQRQGHSIAGVSSRTATSAKRASERLSAPLFKDSLPGADVVLLGVPDANIAEVAEAPASPLSSSQRSISAKGPACVTTQDNGGYLARRPLHHVLTTTASTTRGLLPLIRTAHWVKLCAKR